MRIPAASCSTLRHVLAGPRQPTEVIGVYPSALYLQSQAGEVIAVAARDAVRLPCAVVTARRVGELPLSALVGEPAGAVTVGAGRLDWHGPRGPISVLAVASWNPPALPIGRPDAHAVARVASLIAGCDVGLPGEPANDPDPVVLLGRGPGLTPSGDDVLAGYLIGARAFGLPVTWSATLVQGLAAERTTALSAQLLRHAAAGECAPPLARLVTACILGTDVDSAVAAVRRIGSTSGTALVIGVLLAAHRSHATSIGAAA